MRHQNTSHPADWQRLRELFTEGAVARQDDVWDLHAPGLPQAADGTPDSGVDFVVRSGLNFTVAPEATWRPLAEGTVTAFIAALNASPLHLVLRHLSLAGASTGGMNPFHRQGLNRSCVVRLAWWGAPQGWPDDRPGPVGATVRLEVPGGYGRPATHMQVETDVVVRYSAAAEITRQRDAGRVNMPLPRWRVPPRQLGELISVILETLTSRDVVAPLADLSGIDPLAVPQPRVMHMVTGGPVTEVLDTTGLSPIPDAGYSGGAHLLGDPALDLADDDDRSEQVRRAG